MMSEVERTQMSPIQEHAELYNRQQRRNGMGDIFEHVDVPLLMKKLNLEDATRSSTCSSCSRTCGDIRKCPAASISDVTKPTDIVLKTEDSVLSSATRCDCLKDCDSQWDIEKNQPCLQQNDLHHPLSDYTAGNRNDGITFPATAENTSAESSSFSSAGLHLGSNNSSSSSSSTFRKSESEADSAENCHHAVLAIRPEVCAKRSLIF